MELIPGALSGLTSVLGGYPFDTIKTRSQINNGSSRNILINMIKNEGTLSIYRGVMSPLLTITIKRSYQYYLFDTLKEYNYNPFLAGGLAGLSGSLIGCPMHVLKAQMQATDKTKFKNTFQLSKYIFKNEGFLGFYRGFYINTCKDFIFGASYLGTYTNLKEYFKKYIDNDKLIHFLSGGSAATITWGCFIPIDHFETAIQTKRGSKYVFDKIKNQGITVLWRGSLPILLRIFPVSAISMTVYEFALSKVKKN